MGFGKRVSRRAICAALDQKRSDRLPLVFRALNRAERRKSQGRVLNRIASLVGISLERLGIFAPRSTGLEKLSIATDTTAVSRSTYLKPLLQKRFEREKVDGYSDMKFGASTNILFQIGVQTEASRPERCQRPHASDCADAQRSFFSRTASRRRPSRPRGT